MKKTSKKIIALVMVVVFVFTLTACQNGNKDATSQKEDTALSGEKTSLSLDEVMNSVPEELKGTTIKVFSWNEKNAVSGAAKTIDGFTEKTGIKVDWITASYDTYASELAAMVAANKAPDILRLRNINVSLLKLMQPLSVTEYNYNDAAWDKEAMSYYTVNGKIFATSLKNTLLQQPVVLYYNKNLVTQFGLQDPYALYKKGMWTYDAFIKYCEEFVGRAGDEYFAWSLQDGEDLMNKRGISYVTFDGKQFKSNMSDNKVLEALKETSQIYESGITSSAFWNQAGFNNGKILFFTDSIIGARKSHFYYADMKSSGILGIVPMPKDENDEDIRLMSEYEAYGVAKNAKNPGAAPYFLRYYLDSSNYDEKNFFADQTMLDIYKDVMSSGKPFTCSESRDVLTEATGLVRDSMTIKLVWTPSAQVESILKKYSAKVDNAVKQINNQLKQVG